MRDVVIMSVLLLLGALAACKTRDAAPPGATLSSMEGSVSDWAASEIAIVFPFPATPAAVGSPPEK